ncbi:hypothetical protein C3V39_08305 [Prevotella sp. oral taxon 820]|nr:hypothetical protein C3V39_08305 [Prevotella sp. oral taxon 820]
MFRIRKEERGPALILLLVFIGLNALVIQQHAHQYFLGAHGGFWSIFRKTFEVSGYDCWSWITISGLRVHFDTVRHPLFFSLLYPLYWLNQGLMTLTGHNCAVVLMALVVLFSAVYSGLFLFRILREIMRLSRADSLLLTAFFFSFGHVMLACMVPDHFAVSMLLLLQTFYVSGRAMRQKRDMASWKLGLLAFLTGGISFSNIVKVYLAALFVKGKRVFRWRPILLVGLLPVVLLVGIQRLNYYCFEVPQAREVGQIERKMEQKNPERVRKMREGARKTQAKLNAKDFGDGEIAKWITLSTPRWPGLVENVFGESIQLHRDFALQDAGHNRPVIVRYRAVSNYLVEAVVVALFVLGLWKGRRQRLTALVFSWFLCDAVLHFGLGFALNEVYLMSAGWLFIVPIAVGSLFSAVRRPIPRQTLRYAIVFLTIYLWAYNGQIILQYFL